LPHPHLATEQFHPLPQADQAEAPTPAGRRARTVVGDLHAHGRAAHADGQRRVRVGAGVLDDVGQSFLDSAEHGQAADRVQLGDRLVDVAWCDTEPECALHGTGIRATVAELFARAENGELPGLDPAALTQRIVAPLTQPNLPAVAEEIARLAGTAPTAPGAPPAAEPAGLTPLPIFIQCADNTNRTATFADAEALRARQRAVAPDVRQTAFGIASLCVNPPIPATNPQRPLHAPGAPPVLVMNSRYDASTPHAGARRVAGQLDRAVLVTYDGMGHGAANRSDCTRKLLSGYLADRELPAPDTHCPATA
jgi:pimeloyl-ACP methyl ester carboxylesterase